MTKGPITEGLITKEEGNKRLLVGGKQLPSEILLKNFFCFNFSLYQKNRSSMQAGVSSVWCSAVSPARAAVSGGRILNRDAINICSTGMKHSSGF